MQFKHRRKKCRHCKNWFQPDPPSHPRQHYCSEIRLLRKVTGLRQIEIAEVMVSANNFTKSYAEALVLATPKDHMLAPQEPKKKAGMTAEGLARMEREMEPLEKDFKGIEANYSENITSLTLAGSYIKRLPMPLACWHSCEIWAKWPCLTISVLYSAIRLKIWRPRLMAALAFPWMRGWPGARL
jgi:hypothetical protein